MVGIARDSDDRIESGQLWLQVQQSPLTGQRFSACLFERYPCLNGSYASSISQMTIPRSEEIGRVPIEIWAGVPTSRVTEFVFAYYII